MKKAILFDFWGTLVENGVWSPIKQVRNILRIRLPFPEYVVRMEKAMMTSSFKTLKEAFEAVCDEFNIEPQQFLLEKLIGMWNKSWMLAKPYEEVQEVLQKLSKDYTLILVSNTDAFSVSNVMEKFNLREYFNYLYLSYDLGKIKTDEKFIKHILKELGLKPEECLMVGDSIQSDMEAAEKAGVEAVLVDRRDTREFARKIKNLKEVENYL